MLIMKDVMVLSLVFVAWTTIVLLAIRSMLSDYKANTDKRIDALSKVDSTLATTIETLGEKVSDMEKEVERTNESRRASEKMFQKLFDKVDAIARDVNQVIGELRASHNNGGGNVT